MKHTFGQKDKHIMMCLLSFIFFCLFLNGNAKQNLYKFIPEYAKVSYVNPEYVEITKSSFKKYNRTTGAFNIDFIFKKDIDDSFSIHTTGFLFKSNEFKKTAYDFEMKMCPLFAQLHNFDIGHMLENSNLTLQCPIEKGTYYAHDVIPDAANFPPLMPPGRWLYKNDYKLKGICITTIDFICTVVYS